MCSVCRSKTEAGRGRKGQWSWSQLCCNGWESSCENELNNGHQWLLWMFTLSLAVLWNILILPHWQPTYNACRGVSEENLTTTKQWQKKNTSRAFGYRWSATVMNEMFIFLWYYGRPQFEQFLLERYLWLKSSSNENCSQWDLWIIQHNCENVSGKTHCSYVIFQYFERNSHSFEFGW